MTHRTTDISELPLKQISERLNGVPELIAAYLHGSATQERLRPESDLDIALLYQESHSTSVTDLITLATDLEQIAGRPVHLGRLSLNSLIYATEVYQHGRELICLDEGVKDRFFMRLLSTYADYNRARKPILDTYLIKERDNDEYSTE